MVDAGARAELRDRLDGVRDIERLAARAAAGRANPREMGALRDSFLRLPQVQAALAELAGAHAPMVPRPRRCPGRQPPVRSPATDLAADLSSDRS